MIWQKYASPLFIHKDSNAPASGEDMPIHQKQISLCGVFFAFIQFGDRWNNHDFWEPCTYIPYTWMGISHCFTPQYVCSFIYIAGMINKDVNSSLLLLGYVSPVSFHDDHVPCLLTPFCACCYIHTYISVLMECRRRRRTIAYAPGHACRPSTNNTCIQQQYY